MQPMSRPDPITLLTGAASDLEMPRAISHPGQPNSKFSTSGEALIWPGNTFICHIPRPSAAFDALCYVQEQIKQSAFQRFFTFLPTPSLHMTVFQGYSPDLPREELAEGDFGQPRDTLTERFHKRITPLSLPSSFAVKVHDLYALHSFTVSGASDADESNLRQCREVLRTATGLHPKGFDSYCFHITLAYPLTFVTPRTAQEIVDLSAEISASLPQDLRSITLGPVEFCNFESMHHFEPVARLT